MLCAAMTPEAEAWTRHLREPYWRGLSVPLPRPVATVRPDIAAHRLRRRPQGLFRHRRIMRSDFHPPRAITICAEKPALRAIVPPWRRRSWKWKSARPAARAARRHCRLTWSRLYGLPSGPGKTHSLVCEARCSWKIRCASPFKTGLPPLIGPPRG